MCNAVTYNHGGEEIRCDFSNPDASLPVVTRRGSNALVVWGRRRKEIGELPLGGWAWLDSIRAGVWNRWQPRPVRLQLRSFMEKDIQGESQWFELTSGQWVQGLLAQSGTERRVYVVTIHPEIAEAVHPRWPRIVSG
jgi:hypothetical protein